jgi:hypothetical protein
VHTDTFLAALIPEYVFAGQFVHADEPSVSL